MDIRHFPRQFVTDFITIYKAHPCLWKVKCKAYNSRNLRHEAYKKIIKFCKRNGFPNANRDFVVKKIQSMRGSFRKELKKVTETQQSGEDDINYVPSLWYYNQLLFTKDQELATDYDKSDFDIPENEEDNNKDETVLSPKINQPEVKNMNASRVRKRKPQDTYYTEIMNICTKTCKALIRKEFSEFDAIGINVAKKLKRMDPTQAIYAESLINTVLRRGLLKRLIEDTDFYDSGCKSRQINKSSESFSVRSPAISHELSSEQQEPLIEQRAA